MANSKIINTALDPVRNINDFEHSTEPGKIGICPHIFAVYSCTDRRALLAIFIGPLFFIFEALFL